MTLTFFRRRLRLRVLQDKRWREPGEWNNSLPVPVFLNRFDADLRVFPDLAMGKSLGFKVRRKEFSEIEGSQLICGFSATVQPFSWKFLIRFFLPKRGFSYFYIHAEA